MGKYGHSASGKAIERLDLLDKQIDLRRILLLSNKYLWEITIDDIGKIKIKKVN